MVGLIIVENKIKYKQILALIIIILAKTQIYMYAKPFLKWAGGKTQLIGDIENVLPKNFVSNKFTYIEPFVGSGAILFWMLNNFPKIEKAVINDINADLTNTYKVIASKPIELISLLNDFQAEYHNINIEIFINIIKEIIF